MSNFRVFYSSLGRNEITQRTQKLLVCEVALCHFSVSNHLILTSKDCPRTERIKIFIMVVGL